MDLGLKGRAALISMRVGAGQPVDGASFSNPAAIQLPGHPRPGDAVGDIMIAVPSAPVGETDLHPLPLRATLQW